MNTLTSSETAAALYRDGNKRAAKALLCERPEVQAEFQRTPWPCAPKTDAALEHIR
jgi:hypothetical protein